VLAAAGPGPGVAVGVLQTVLLGRRARTQPKIHIPGAKRLLDQAVREKEIPAIDSAPLAHVLGGLGREFARPEHAAIAGAGAKATADAIAEIILRGLTSGEG
jgi:hypothetical protein